MMPTFAKKFYKTNKLRTTPLMKKTADTTTVISPKNKEVLYALEIIRQQLQFEGENMDTFLRLDRQMQDSRHNKIKQQSRSISFETNKIKPLFVCFYLLFEQNV